MTRLRAVIVAATIAGSIGFSVAAIAFDRLLWPFAHYPMYSRLFGPRAEVTRAVGVVGDREVPLPRQVGPRELHLHLVISDARRRADSTTRLRQIATAMWAEYERLRASGEFTGPPLDGVRIYRETVGLAAQPHLRRSMLVVQGPAQ